MTIRSRRPPDPVAERGGGRSGGWELFVRLLLWSTRDNRRGGL